MNVKLLKAGGLRAALHWISLARELGLMVMLGVMVETGIGRTAAAQLAPLADWLDIDPPEAIPADPMIGFQHSRRPIGAFRSSGTWPGGRRIEMVNSTDSRFVGALVPSAPSIRPSSPIPFSRWGDSVVACVSQGPAQSSDVGWRGPATSTNNGYAALRQSEAHLSERCRR